MRTGKVDLVGVYPNYAAHPLRQLHSTGVTITVSTDDPPLFETTLNEEVTRLATHFGLDIAAIDEILLNGIRCSFLPEPRRLELEETFRTKLDTLKTKYLTT